LPPKKKNSDYSEAARKTGAAYRWIGLFSGRGAVKLLLQWGRDKAGARRYRPICGENRAVAGSPTASGRNVTRDASSLVHGEHVGHVRVGIGVCEPECPVDIKPDTKPGLERWLDLNRQYSQIWPNITRKKPAPPDADAFVNVPDKFAKYFSPNPGEGD
jgi:Domain of unknown function (DUF3470)